ncbi:MAG: hypothetical protein KJO69_01200 [Gammaproteobacteria bacterium]|nr:hypothetical protein [Gammaproteobacteria bacterium]NNJ72244.1 hypothetical protein [Enterobacterales bacterium]
MTVSPIASGIQAFMAAQQKLNVSAEKIAGATLSEGAGAVVEPLIDLRIAEQQAKAAARVIETENATIGSLLDIEV